MRQCQVFPRTSSTPTTHHPQRHTRHIPRRPRMPHPRRLRSRTPPRPRPLRMSTLPIRHQHARIRPQRHRPVPTRLHQDKTTERRLQKPHQPRRIQQRPRIDDGAPVPPVHVRRRRPHILNPNDPSKPLPGQDPQPATDSITDPQPILGSPLTVQALNDTPPRHHRVTPPASRQPDNNTRGLPTRVNADTPGPSVHGAHPLHPGHDHGVPAGIGRPPSHPPESSQHSTASRPHDEHSAIFLHAPHRPR